MARVCSWFDAGIELECQFELKGYEHQQLFLCIASALRPEPMPGADQLLARVKASRAKRTRLLCDAWEAAVARNQQGFDKALREAVRYFLEHELRKTFQM